MVVLMLCVMNVTIPEVDICHKQTFFSKNSHFLRMRIRINVQKCADCSLGSRLGMCKIVLHYV